MNTSSGRVALITGAAGTLGRAVATTLGRQGLRLALLARREDDLHGFATAKEAGQRLCLAADLLDTAQVEYAVAQTLQRLGRIDILCNIAGGFHMGDKVHETSDEAWDFMFNINVRTLTNMASAVVPHMLEAGSGKIVNIGAFAARHGEAGKGAYIASKSAVIRLTESMALELRAQGINVNCVLPTIIDTPANRAAMPDADPARWVAPEALADVIAFLASDAARAVHGAALPVTGLS
ncbi:MAG: SDR family NAD(P)-dependent oxidoreductase [Ottowia sp.]|nr:SDR family oxidoreductase [Ottowia sp.]